MGRESWHAIKKLSNLPFLTLKVRYPVIRGFSLSLGVVIIESVDSNVGLARTRNIASYDNRALAMTSYP